MATTKKTAKKPAKKLQRRWKVGTEYKVEGTGSRRIKLVGRGTLNGREVLMFHPVRRAAKNNKAS